VTSRRGFSIITFDRQSYGDVFRYSAISSSVGVLNIILLPFDRKRLVAVGEEGTARGNVKCWCLRTGSILTVESVFIKNNDSDAQPTTGGRADSRQVVIGRFAIFRGSRRRLSRSPVRIAISFRRRLSAAERLRVFLASHSRGEYPRAFYPIVTTHR